MSLRHQNKKGIRTCQKLLDKILSRENMLEAYNQVKSNKGSAGIDGITIEEMDNYLRQNWRLTKERIKQKKI